MTGDELAAAKAAYEAAWQQSDYYGWAKTYGDALLAELARLRAVVERLPKTADGVPVTPKMQMYWPSGVEAAVLAVWFDGTLDLQSHDEAGMPTNNWKRLQADGWGYSTRALAKSAAKGGV